MFTDLLVVVAAIVVSWLGVSYIKRWALRHRILDVPNERSSHEAPIPRGGGIAIVVTVIVGVLLLNARGPSLQVVLAWIAGSVLVAAVSWLDDLRSVPSAVRLLVHATAAMIVIMATGPLTSIGTPTLGLIGFSSAGYVLTLLWVVGLTNAFNFMDGIDGIAGAQAVCAGAAAAIAGHMQTNRGIEFMGALIVAASIGFLIHNWSPATIFMGDVGSAFLGYSLAVIPVMSTNAQPEILFVIVCALWPFLFDTTFTFMRRLIKRENVLQAHRSHLYQRLVQSGATHASVVLLYTAGAAIGSALAIAALRSAAFAVATLITIPAMAAALLILVSIRERQRTSGVVRDSRHPAYHES
jgi:UDP-N-acetylmuramyl pentapeptide phosphotransferase/UDP-N-acetylglucosamine-1-phosphate transferase